MHRSIPRAHGNLRVFYACLLSFMTLMAPLASLAAASPNYRSTAAKTTAAPSATTTSTASSGEKTVESVDAQEASLFLPAAPHVPAASSSASSRFASVSGGVASVSFFLPAAGDVTATMTDVLVPADDTNGDGNVDPGEKITYTATLNNPSGGAGATGLSFNVPIDSHTTLSGPVQSTPVAFDQTVAPFNEDSGAQNITLQGQDPDGSDLTFSIVTPPDVTKGSLGSIGAVTCTNGVCSATVAYTPVANAFGNDSFTFTVNDGTSNSNEVGTVSITINSVNDAPGFTNPAAGEPPAVNEDAAGQTINGFITNISAGPANESSQIVDFVIDNNSHTALFAVQPAISPTGTLTYTPAPNANGSATITYHLHDNGGTANGGTDVSSPNQTFTITVNAVNDAPVAQDKAFTVQSNMKIFGLTGLLVGVTDPDATNGAADPLSADAAAGYTAVNVSLTSITANTCTNSTSTITSNATGTFNFDPPPGLRMGATCVLRYTVTDTGHPGNAVSVAKDITITAQGPAIWFVQPGRATNGNGTLSDTGSLAGAPGPFNSLASAKAKLDDLTANQRVFVYKGTGSTAVGDTLALAGTSTQAAAHWLIGEGAIATNFDTLMGISPPINTITRPTVSTTANGAANRPTIQGTVSMKDNTVVQGVNINVTTTQGLRSVTPIGAGSVMTIKDVNVTSTTGNAVDFNSAQTISYTSSDTSTSPNILSSTTGIALNVINTTIGAGGLIFRSISSNGAPSGIVLNNTGSVGGLTVTGNTSGNCGGSVTVNAVGTAATVGAPVTADCSGGTIQASTGSGIVLSNSANVSLTRIRILNSGADGINALTVNNFTLARSLITDSSGAAGDRGIEMGDFSTGTPVNGAINITNSTIGPTPHDNFGVGIASGTSTWNLTGTVFDDSQLNSGFNFEIRNATVTSFVMDGCVLQGQFADGMQMQPASGVNATVTSATIQNTTFQNNNIGMDLNHDGTSSVTYKVLSNTFLNQVANSINFFSSAAVGTGGTLNGRFVGNVIGNSAVFKSGGGIGIRININGGADATVLVDNNTIRQIPDGRGIEIISRNGTGGTDATVTNNNVNTDFVPTAANGGFSLSNIFLQSNCVGANGCNTLRSDIRGNTVPAVAPTGELVAGQLVVIRTSGAPNGGGTSTNQLVDNAPASATALAELQSHNTGSMATSGTITLIAGPISTPPLMLAAGGVNALQSGFHLTTVSIFDRLSTGDDLSPFDLANRSWSENINGSSIWKDATGLTGLASTVPALTQHQLNTIVSAAIERWSRSGLTQEQNAALHNLKFEVTDLSRSHLGTAAGDRILVDRDAGGKGWFVDSNPLSDASFAHAASATRLYTDPLSAPAGRVDLLTAIAHEIGHKLGLNDSYAERDRDDLMYGYLTVGERRLPARGQARGGQLTSVASTHFLSLGSEERTQTVVIDWGSAPSTYLTVVPGRSVPEFSGNRSSLERATNPSAEIRSMNAINSRKDVRFNHAPKQRTAKTNVSATESNIVAPNAGNTVAMQPVVAPLFPVGTFPVNGTGTGFSLPPGKTTTITFKVQVNNPPNFSSPTTNKVSHQGTLSGAFQNNPVVTDDPNTGAANDATEETVDLFNTTTTLTSSPTTPASGQAVTYTATVAFDSATAPPSPAVGTDPSGTVSFFDNGSGTPITGCANVALTGPSGNRTAQCNVAAISSGAHSVVAKYSGDGNFDPSDSAALVQSVAQSSTTTTVTSSLNPSLVTQDVTFTATVTTTTSPAPTITGTVTFKDGGTDIVCDSGLAFNGSTATCVTNDLAAGNHNITAVYSGDTNFTTSTGTLTGDPQVVNKSGTSTNLASGQNPSQPGDVTFTATITSQTSVNPVDGTVDFFKDNVLLNPVPPCDNVPVVAGQAQCTVNFPVDGTFAIKAEYNGSNTFLASTSNTVSQVIQSCTTPIEVTTTADSGAGSLRQALLDICDGGTITFSPITFAAPGPHFINLADTAGNELAINKSVTITGPGASVLTVRRALGAVNKFRVFNVALGKTATISGMTISNGDVVGTAGGVGLPGGTASGGGILNAGTLTLQNVIVSSNKVTGGDGGAAVAAPGGNGGDAKGGGIYNSGTLTLTNTTVDGSNTATGGAGGSSDTVNGNGGEGLGGGVYTLGSLTLTVTGSTISGNLAIGGLAGTGTGTAGTLGSGSGGGIYNDGSALAATANITNSTISGNTATLNGGGVFNNGALANATLTSVTVTGNSADNDNNATGTGGGINNASGTFTLKNTIVAGNLRGSGILQVETATVDGTITADGNAKVVVTASGMTNSPKTVTVAVVNGDTAEAVAGKMRTALAADPDVSSFFTVSGATDQIVLTAKTIAANDATMNIATDNDTSTGLTATPTSANTTPGRTADDIAGTINTAASASTFNLIGDAATSGGLVEPNTDNNQVGVGGAGIRHITTILNSLLANNGGPTKTHALVAGSAAIDKGNDFSVSATTDQRGFVRPFDFDSTPPVAPYDDSDIGAFEIQHNPPTITKGFSPASIQSGGTSTITLTLTNSNAIPLTNVSFTDTLVNMSASAGSVTGTCTGTLPASFTGGETALSFSGIGIPANGSCTVIFNVTSSTPGVQPNSTSGATSTQTVTTGAASNVANLTVLAAPTIAKAFGPTTIQSGGSSTVTVTLTNTNATQLTNASFADILVNMSAAGGAAAGTCVGASSNVLVADATSLSFTGITIPASGDCTVTFAVKSSTVGVNPNTTSGVTTAETTTAGAVSNTANLTVLGAPTIAKAFSPTSIQSGGSSNVTLTLTNGNATPLTNASFTDTLVNMAAVGGTVTGTCAGTTPNTLAADATALSFTGITIPASGNCTVIFAVKSSNLGVNPNSTSGVTTTQTTTAGAVSNTANLTVFAPATIAKAFSPTDIASGGSSTVTLTLSNSNASDLTNGAFTDTLVNMSAVGGSVTGTCVGTTPNTLSANATALSFTGITIPGSGNCTVIFDVKSSTPGVNPNSTSGVTATETPTGGAASNTANLTVFAPPQVVSITRVNPNPTNLAQVDFTVTFSKAVTGVNAADFTVTTTGGIVLIPSPVTNVTPAGPSATYTVTVDTGTGDGTLRLNVIDDDSIQSTEAVVIPLGGTGAGNGNFTTGEVYTVSKSNPFVTSITRVEANPTNLATVNFNVVFSKSVTGVNIGVGSDFVLVDGTNSITGESITGLSGSGANYTVTVNTGTGNGTLGLNVVDDDSIIDSSSRPLGGPGPVNGDFTGDIFTVDKTAPTVTIAKASDQADPATGPTATTTIRFKAVFSEAVTGFIASDVTITGTAGATLATITEVAPDYPANTQPLNGTTYEVSISGMTQSGTVIVQVNNNAVQDAAGNLSTPASATASVQFNADNATSFEVNTVADTTDGSCDPLGTGTGNQDCTLREAILRANADFGAETITFNSTVFAAPGPYTINLTGVLPDLSTDMTIAGPGAKVLTVKRNTGGNYRIFTISGVGNPNVTIVGLTISNGNVGGLPPASRGAGIFVSTTGTVNITNSTISGNTASDGGGGIFQSAGTLNITNTTVSGNSAIQGGALETISGTVNITNSTLSGNSVSGSGGGLAIDVANVTITHTTITANVADNDNNSVGTGGGIFRNSGTVTLRNTVVARNLNGNEKQVETATVAGAITADGNAKVTVTAIGMGNTPKTLLVPVLNGDSASVVAGKMRTALAADPDVSGFFTVSGAGANIVLTALTARATDTTLNIATDNDTSTGLTPAPTSADTTAGATADDIAGTMEATSSFNLIGAGGAGGLVNGTNDNQVGVTDPGLFPLADNGGSTFTHALRCVSPAIDKGSAFSIFNDQRGGTRPLDLADTVYPNASSPGTGADGSDIGAFEVQTGGGCLPVAVPPAVDPTVTNEDTLVVITLTGTYSQNTPLTFTITDQPDNGSALTPSAPICNFTTFMTCTSTVNYTPNSNYHGPDAFKFRVSAGGLNSDEADVNITVTSVNDRPVANNDTLSDVIMNSGQRIIPWSDLLGNDSPGPADESGQTLVVSSVSNPTGGTVTNDPANSRVLFTPTNNFFGPAGFRYFVQDSGAAPNTSVTFGVVGFTIISPPLIQKNFGDTTVDMNVETVSLTFKVTNPNNGTVLNGIGFIDNLPGGLEVATPSGLSGTCGGGTITAADGSTQISLAGATLNANVFCTFSVNIRGTSIGVKNNVSDPVTSTEGGNGGTANASITVLAPDMTITKTHSGSFDQGQTETYTITVTNSGNAATTAPVTMTDVLPVGLTPTGPNGVVNGWTCNINGQTVTCTRSDVLAPATSYPAITVTVEVANPAPLTVTNTATVAGGGEQTTNNNSASDMTSINCLTDFSLNNTNPLMISRFRMNGPAGPQDEFVEIFNPSTTAHTVASGNCAGGGYGVYASSGNGTTSNAAPLVCFIPNGTVIAAGGYYLCTGATYSLSNLGRNGGPEGATSIGDAPIGCNGLCSPGVPDDAGLALMNVAQGINLTPDGGFVGGVAEAGFILYDKVGFGPYGDGAPSPNYPSMAGNFCEGAACLKPVGDAGNGGACDNSTGLFPVFAAPGGACYGEAGQYQFLRRQTVFDPALGTVHIDTNNSANDFILVSPNPGFSMGLAVTGVGGVTAILGSAAPQGSIAPPDTPSVSLKQGPFDSTRTQFGAPNAERSYGLDPTVLDPANNPGGTFALRLRFTNNSASNIGGLRFRIDQISTLCGAQTESSTVGSGSARNLAAAPDCGTGSLTAILKLLNSAQEVVIDNTGTAHAVNGTVIEDLSASATPTPPGAGPLSPGGSGLDSSFIVNPSSDIASLGDGVSGGTGVFATAISTTDPNKVLRIKIKFGVVRSGRFILLITPATKPAP